MLVSEAAAASADPRPSEVPIKGRVTVEIEGEDKPALAGESPGVTRFA